MRKIFEKPISKMDELESRYFGMEVQSAVNNITRQHNSKGGQFPLALSVALRDEAGRQLYKNGNNSDGNDSNDTDSGGEL